MAQARRTAAQLRRIYALARERGLDNEMLHAYVFNLTGKNSLKDLTIREAVTVIDALSPSGGRTAGGITEGQHRYILSLAKELGWVEEGGEVNRKTLDAFLLKNCGKYAVQWMTAAEAAKLIEGMKPILEKDRKRQQEQGL